jgi:hypothetical protein
MAFQLHGASHITHGLHQSTDAIFYVAATVSIVRILSHGGVDAPPRLRNPRFLPDARLTESE